MHELSIAQNVIEWIQRSLPPEDLPRVRVVRLRVGALAGVVPDSLEFSFAAATYGTTLERAALDIEARPFVVRCLACGERTSNELGWTVCDLCGSRDTVVDSGMELDLVHLDLQDPPPS
ncbi:MAG: hypothetical protein A2X67_03380 [Ignavibacteria bacterium GWA2_55_11]|nr:MAG: hypothetical protein A2X67_03380 [Ignavibacteria bacterium GWA2_55_11]OGU75627.1 MAG: hypothetical protein A3H45_11695 [Ignavibacteria bacterium RIFCSPLOWO2_02_FULL_55_14]OGU76661.1 MAG: hypothetical protein A3G43_03610 [Ignavibacteria bacterium RIFCSPLOWO2_12_FULL_56_21]